MAYFSMPSLLTTKRWRFSGRKYCTLLGFDSCLVVFKGPICNIYIIKVGLLNSGVHSV